MQSRISIDSRWENEKNGQRLSAVQLRERDDGARRHKRELVNRFVRERIKTTVEAPIAFGTFQEDLGVDFDEFQHEFSPSFDRLPEDDYVRRARQHAAVLAVCRSDIDGALVRSSFKAFYNGSIDLETLCASIQVSPNDVARIRAMHSPRTRAVGFYDLSPGANGAWAVQRQPHRGFAQAGDDPLVTLERRFGAIEDGVADHPLFQTFLKNTGAFAHDRLMASAEKRPVRGIEVVVHQVRIDASNSPTDDPNQPPHKDGVPYIISAAVHERPNVGGGQSRILSDTFRKPVMTLMLQSGEFLAQADDPSPYLHHGEKIYLDDPSAPGSRRTWGFDLTPRFE